ncbi:MAG: amidohydrolase family protein [Acidimicrobiia bacterium]
MSKTILVRGGVVLTLGVRTANFARADVLVEERVIAEVGPGLRARDAELIDATEAIVMPGFVDTHRHLWKSLFRNFGEAMASGGSLQSPSVYGPHYRPDDVYAATLIGLLGAAEAGITTVVDWADLPHGAGHVEAALEAHADSGLRTVFAFAAPDWSMGSADLRSLIGGLSVRGDHTTLALGSRELAGDLEVVETEWTAARGLGLRIHAHAGIDPANSGVVARLGGQGQLGEDVTLVHCSLLDASDLDAIAASGASVSMAPASEMAIGLGAPPIQGLIDRGIRPGLGVDQEALAPGDIFAAMRAVNSMQHASSFDLKLAGKAGIPNLLSTREVIRYATSDGARVAGLGDVTGSIEPGKRADILVLRADRPNIHPVNDPIGAVVWGMDTSNVDWVLVGGKPLVRDGELSADSARARGLALAAHRRVAEAAGLTAGMGATS